MKRIKCFFFGHIWKQVLEEDMVYDESDCIAYHNPFWLSSAGDRPPDVTQYKDKCQRCGLVDSYIL